MKKSENKKKLSLNKLKISQITNLASIRGGDDDTTPTTRGACLYPENSSKPIDTDIRP